MDDLTKEQRHKAMSRIRSKDTAIEVKLRKALWHSGYRYRKNYAARIKNKQQHAERSRRGKTHKRYPDLVFAESAIDPFHQINTDDGRGRQNRSHKYSVA